MQQERSDNLLDQIENSPSIESLRIWGLSGAGFVLRFGDEIVYVDPWLVPPDPKRTTHRAYSIPFPPERVRKAVAVISTHEHADHCDVPTIAGIVKSTDAVFIGPKSATDKATKGGLPLPKAITVSPGSRLEISPSFKVRVFGSSDPYESLAVMVLLETPRGNILHSGDTSYFGGFKEVGSNYSVDVALLNFGKQIPTPEKPYYMNAQKLAMAARDLRAKIVVPMHWNLWEETKEDPSPIKSILREESPRSEFKVIDFGELLQI
ncbi:MAG TPA: MBL fold metallo-hydrolase [Nitrososphaerales archaeon]|nr:MBL fold metallo-hydrolase [Nitrososphaerales archaeon]